MNGYVEWASEVAREAGALLLRYYERRVRVEYKAGRGDVDVVTEADRASEAFILERLRARYPDHAIVAEEGGGRESPSPYRWYIDPLDGTTNFAHSFPQFCVSMGLEYEGKMSAAVVYDPTRDELFTAERGRGAYLNGRPIHVSAIKNLEESLMATGFPSRKRHQSTNIHFYYQLTMASHGVRRPGSAALDLCYVACGRLDAFWEFQLSPWDTAAGWLIAEEAGGRVTDMHGQAYGLSSGSIAASNGLIHGQMIGEFDRVFRGEFRYPLPPV